MNIVELVKKEVQRQIEALAKPTTAIVSSVDKDSYSVKVQTDNGDETNWLRIIVPAAGVKAGLGIRLPKAGDEVVIIYTDFEHHNGFVMGAIYNEDEESPLLDDEHDMVIARWENGGEIKVSASRDGSAPILTISNNQGDEIKVDNGAISIKTTNKDVTVDAGSGKATVKAQNLDIDTLVACTLNGGVINVNNLPACLFTGAPHGTNPKNKG